MRVRKLRERVNNRSRPVYVPLSLLRFRRSDECSCVYCVSEAVFAQATGRPRVVPEMWERCYPVDEILTEAQNILRWEVEYLVQE